MEQMEQVKRIARELVELAELDDVEVTDVEVTDDQGRKWTLELYVDPDLDGHYGVTLTLEDWDSFTPVGAMGTVGMVREGLDLVGIVTQLAELLAAECERVAEGHAEGNAEDHAGEQIAGPRP